MEQETADCIVRHEAPVRFETLLSEASAAFIRVLADDIDSEIESWLQRFGTMLGVHKAALFQIDRIDGKLKATHIWFEPGVPPNILATFTADYPWMASKILAGEMLVFDDVNDAPAEAAKDLLEVQKHKGKSGVTVPLRIGGQVAGAVAAVSVVKRKWNAETVQQLQQITTIFGIALERQQSAALVRKLREENQNVLRTVPMAEITASLAHELNQPLGAILNNAQAVRRLLSAKRLDVEDLKDAAEGIIRDVGRVGDIVRHTREAFHSVGNPKLSVDVRELLFDLERVLRSDAKSRGISLRVSVPPSLPCVISNRQGLIQVLMNLILNAFDAIEECPEGARQVELSANCTSTDIHVRVHDTGKGIDPRISAQLFSAFVTTKPSGTGMGLAIARSIVEKSGGRIWAVQKMRPGTTIEFTLPIEGRAL
ncbi:MAG: HAMP domain-containing histidine kinase [Deltaproteobacteria bacterium]|nr:HAMP domain-containing histidine kinase [Deltaproteobacteria bacterium]